MTHSQCKPSTGRSPRHAIRHLFEAMSPSMSNFLIPSESTLAVSINDQTMSQDDSHGDKRKAHNALERQRREGLNVKYQQLAHALPSLQTIRRPSKSMIVTKSVEFVSNSINQETKHQRQIKLLLKENERLRRQARRSCLQLQKASGGDSHAPGPLDNQSSRISTASPTPSEDSDRSKATVSLTDTFTRSRPHRSSAALSASIERNEHPNRKKRTAPLSLEETTSQDRVKKQKIPLSHSNKSIVVDCSRQISPRPGPSHCPAPRPSSSPVSQQPTTAKATASPITPTVTDKTNSAQLPSSSSATVPPTLSSTSQVTLAEPIWTSVPSTLSTASMAGPAIGLLPEYNPVLSNHDPTLLSHIDPFEYLTNMTAPSITSIPGSSVPSTSLVTTTLWTTPFENSFVDSIPPTFSVPPAPCPLSAKYLDSTSSYDPGQPHAQEPLTTGGTGTDFLSSFETLPLADPPPAYTQHPHQQGMDGTWRGPTGRYQGHAM